MAHDLDIGGGIGQGIQLGAAGFAAGGPIGGLIGGGVGLATGLIGGRRRRRTEQRLRQRNDKLLAMLQGNVDRLQGQSAGGTAEFQSGRAELEGTISRQAGRDASAAAARGLTGSSFEISQASNRARALGRGTTRLLATSETRLSQDRRAAVARLLQGFGLAGSTDLSLIGGADRRAAASGAALGSGFEAATGAGLFSRGSGGHSQAGEAGAGLIPALGRPTFGNMPFIDSVPEGVPAENPFLFG